MCSLNERLKTLKNRLNQLNQFKTIVNELDKSVDKYQQIFSHFIPFEEKLICGQKRGFHLNLCQISDKMITNVTEIDTKIGQNGQNITKSKQFKCFWPKCLFKTSDSRLLKDHYSVHQKSKNQFRCDVNNCQKVFKYKQNLIQHKLNHKSQLNIRQQFPQKLQLIQRQNNSSLANKTVGKVGHKSGAGRENNDEKNGHKTGQLIVAHKSNVLSKMSANDQNLSAGQTADNGPQRPKKRQVFRKPKDKRFVCDYGGCDKCFDSKSNLERHKRIHSGEKPFGCDIPDCGQRFTQKTHLVQHKKRKHRIILPKNAIKLIKPIDDPIKPVADTPPATPVVESVAKTPVVFTPLKTAVNSAIKVAVNSPKPSVNNNSTPKTTPLSTKTAVNSRPLTKHSANTPKLSQNSLEKTKKISELSVNSTDRQYKCYYTKCKASYESLYELKTHINGIHTNETLNKCHEINCNEMVFKSFYNLYYHKKTFHKLV